MSAPVMTTTNASGNLLTSTSIAASGTTSFTLDVSSKVKAIVQVGATFGTIAAVAGLQVDVFRRVGSTPVVDTDSAVPMLIKAVAGARVKSLTLETGRYTITLTNLDATNGLTSVFATDDTVDSYS